METLTSTVKIKMTDTNLISGALRVLPVIWCAGAMRRKEKSPAWAAFKRTPFAQRAKAILIDTALVVLVILCFKVVAFVMSFTGASPELFWKFTLLKDFVFLIVYTVLSVHLLDQLGLFALLERLHNFVKGKTHGASSAIVAA